MENIYRKNQSVLPNIITEEKNALEEVSSRLEDAEK